MQTKDIAKVSSGGWIVLLIIGLFSMLLQSCTMHIGMDWNGETSLDKRTFTEKKGK